MLDLSGEATAAIIGAGVGVVLSSAVQLLVTAVTRRRDRREAAALIYLELIANYAAAEAAVIGGGWPTAAGEPRRAAWENVSGQLLGRRLRDAVTMIAAAYSWLDDIAVSVAGGGLLDEGQIAERLTAIRAGAYQAGRLAGYTHTELVARQLWNAEVEAETRRAMSDMHRSKGKRRGLRP